MDAKSEVILRQPDLFTGKILLINPPQDHLVTALNHINVHIWTWNFADFQFFQNNNVAVTFAITPPQDHFDQAIIFVPKAKELLNYVLEQATALLGQGKSIFLVGEKKAGIEGAAKQLQPFGKSFKIDSARHCQLWQLIIDKDVKTKPLETWIKTYRYQQQEFCLDIYALPGVFSQNHLDIGTQQLLPYLNQINAGNILDFGCGAGVIAVVLAKINPACQITAVDIDAFALKSTELTFVKNNLNTQVEIKAITDIQDIGENFDAIVSNPPFHQGIKTHYQASENLCRYAYQHLNKQGELWIVANRFLNYPPLIEQNFAHCLTKADQQGFKILFAKKG